MSAPVRHYANDVGYLVRTSPYLHLAKPGAAERFLAKQVEAARDCLTALAAYPVVLVEPLEFFYTCLRSLGALDLPLMEALLAEHNWRGVVWGAWLAMVAPNEQFVPLLRGARARVAHSYWLVDCALSTIAAATSEASSASVVRLGASCRDLLCGVERPVTRLRREPAPAEVLRMSEERERVRQAYLDGGVESARSVLRGTLLEVYAMDYPKWASSGSWH